MAHKLKGVPYATDFFIAIEGKEFSKGAFEGTELYRGCIRLSHNSISLKYAKRGEYISTPIKAPFSFNEILPSWNITMPARTGFSVFIRVSKDTRTWTPWLYLGTDGVTASLNKKDKILKYDDIEVDTDYILIDSTVKACQFRLVLYSRDGVLTPYVHLFSLSLTNSKQDKALWEKYGDTRDELTTPPRAISLPVPFFSQLDAQKKEVRGATCCPTCATMLLNYFGRVVSLDDVIDANYDPEYKIWGIWPKTGETLWRYGLRSYIRRFRSFRQIYEILEQKIPIIASIQANDGEIKSAALYSGTSGHIIVISGMDRFGHIYVCDPYAHNESEGCRIYKRSEIKASWLDRGGVGIIGEPILARP